ncbi:asparagine synthase-related protein [Streptosporangium sp. LJ11]|uniref:asparagine synthase-related protein n=1 Tax=Streptosporangium sp. LJ11 TaxID=3436927 RepID=UPI003F78C54E
MHLTVATDTWSFLALPDNDAARSVADRVESAFNVLANHPSGRPWLLGSLPPAQVVVHDAGPHRLALVGSTAVTTAQLGRVSDDLRSVGDMTGVSARFAGNYCVVGSLGGLVYAQGSAIGTRRVFHALVDGVRVVSDRADVLAELGGLPIDEIALALRLMLSLPHPFGETPLWQGLRLVAPEDYVTVDRDGRGWTTGTWWRRPEPMLSRAEGARHLRAAMEAAVQARTESGGLVACDLSGGMDSTPLCYFAARGAGGVLARTTYWPDPGGMQDLEWARTALPSMPGVREHVVESSDDMPDFFGGLLDMRDRLDVPSQAAMTGPRVTGYLWDDAARGITTHLNGLGGDHLLRGMASYEHSLFRTRPLLAWRRARALHLSEGLRIRDTLRELLTSGSYRSWLQGIITTALEGTQSLELPRISDWSPALELPPWLSVHARDALIVKLRDIASTAEPLGPDRAAHMELSMLRDAAPVVRGFHQLGHRAGVAHDAPLFDDQVAEAVLTVRREERVSPLEWKPLMKAAMRGLLPDEFLRRSSKVGGAAQAVRGFSAHYEELLTLCESSGLPALGLIDMAKLVETTRPDPKAMPPAHFTPALFTALFLRNQTRDQEAYGTKTA